MELPGLKDLSDKFWKCRTADRTWTTWRAARRQHQRLREKATRTWNSTCPTFRREEKMWVDFWKLFLICLFSHSLDCHLTWVITYRWFSNEWFCLFRMSQRQSWRSRRACRRRRRDLRKAVMELQTSSCLSEVFRSSGLLCFGMKKSVKPALDFVLPKWRTPRTQLNHFGSHYHCGKRILEWISKYLENCKRQQIQEQPVFKPVYPEISNLTDDQFIALMLLSDISLLKQPVSYLQTIQCQVKSGVFKYQLIWEKYLWWNEIEIQV